MKGRLKKALNSILGKSTDTLEEGDEGIGIMGHREYVGGKWEEIGRLQFDFLVQQGLKPTHCFLDIACGCLRGGINFIQYLEPGNYLGIEKESSLIDIGIHSELGKEIYEHKKPELVVSGAFEFHKFSKRPHFSLAQSLFSHLSETDICLCLKHLGQFVGPDHIFFATFLEGDSVGNPTDSHSLKGFEYTRAAMEHFGESNGWKATYIGDWNHPRNQKMIKYEIQVSL